MTVDHHKRLLCREAAQRHAIPLDVDFHTLSASQCDTLAQIAKRLHYRAPRNRNGSTARCFYRYITE